MFSANKDEVRKGYYDISPEEVGQEENINEPQTFEAILRLRSPVFEQDRKWQFYYGEQRVSATLRDMDYVNRVFVLGERSVKLRFISPFLWVGAIHDPRLFVRTLWLWG